MIYWQDFILDDVCGPLLMDELLKDINIQVCRGKRIGNANIMDDVAAVHSVQIQEARQDQRPARMEGLSNLDSHHFSGMEAGKSYRSQFSWQEEEA